MFYHLEFDVNIFFPFLKLGLGINGLLGFKNTLEFTKVGDWERAANGMLASKWAKQVGRRAIELSELMRKGQ